MKKIYLLFLMAVSANASYSQKLISYGNNVVTTEEFLRAYNKNKVPVTDNAVSIREYIDLYSNFKLKVLAASELRLDTMPQVLADIENFRTQVQENYMSDEKGREELYNQAFERSLKDLHIIHFSVAMDTSTSPADSMKAFKAIHDAYNALQNGRNDYAAIVGEHAPLRYSDVGFVTVFSLPYQFENIIYNLKPGQVSKPVRTKTAWHLFKLAEERPSAGKWKIAQILFSLPPGASDADKAIIEKRADSVYNMLVNGIEFSALVKKYSEDKLTYMTGGELPEFTTGKFDQVFEKEVTRLKANGDFSHPFKTAFGYHIIKRLAHTPISTDKNDPSTQFDFKQKVQKDSRIESSKQKFSKEIKAKIGYRLTGNVREADIIRYADSAARTGKTEGYPISKKELIKFNNGSAAGSDWLKFVTEYKNNFNEYTGESFKELWEKYQAYAANKYYKDHLENYNTDFKYQMKEFKEGNMLFEIMERNVWGVANSDTAGLKQYYNANKSKYTWPVSADVLIFNASNEKSAESSFNASKNGKTWKEIAAENPTSVQVDSGRYELSQIFGNETAKQVPPQSYSVISKNEDGTASFVKYLTFYPSGQQRSFEEARGLVINDYQNLLEEKWLAQLRKKYPVKINDTELKKIIK